MTQDLTDRERLELARLEYENRVAAQFKDFVKERARRDGEATDIAAAADCVKRFRSLVNQNDGVLEAIIRDALWFARSQQREACAKLADELQATYEVRDYEDHEAKAKGGYAVEVKDFAAAIRARV